MEHTQHTNAKQAYAKPQDNNFDINQHCFNCLMLLFTAFMCLVEWVL